MTTRSACDLVSLFFKEMSQGDLGAVARHTDPGVVYVIYGENEGTRGAIPWAGRHEGHAALQAAFSTIFAHLGVTEFAVSSMFGVDDMVAIFGSYTAQARATGRRFTTPFAQRARVRNGLIIECLMFEDSQAVALALRP